MEAFALGDNGSNKLGSGWSFDRKKIFYRLRVSEGMARGANATDPLYDKGDLIVRLTLTEFLDSPVVVSDPQIDIDHRLSFQGEDKKFRLFL